MKQSAVLATALALALFLRVSHVSGQWVRGLGENLAANIASDNMYRFRVAVTPRRNLVYGIDAEESTVAQFTFNRSSRGLGIPAWSSPPIPGLSVKQPVLNVDTTTDQVYFIHPADGKIYCYDANLNSSSPVWVSAFVCSAPSDPGDQHLQAFTANGQRLLARCNNSVVLLGPRGALLKQFSSPSVRAFVNASDLAAPLPVFSNFTRMLTWFSNTSGSYLEIWPLDGTVRQPTRPLSTIALPPGAEPSGVNSDSAWWTVVADKNAPAVHLLSPFTGKFQSSYNFAGVKSVVELKAQVDADDVMQLSVLPTPVIVDKTMYGILQAVLPSPYPWMAAVLPDKYYWWMFALNCSAPKAPTLQWITPPQNTSGRLAPQVPWVTARAVFVTDYQQNATRGFDRANSLPFFNFPSNPYTRVLTQFSLSRGTYKMSLPWVSPDGYFQMVQFDDWMYDNAGPEERQWLSRGNIRTILGAPFSPPPPVSPSPPPRPPPPRP